MYKLFSIFCILVLPLVFSCKKNTDNDPAITEVSPLKGAFPNHITIRGMRFGSNVGKAIVKFGLDSARILSFSDTALVVEMPVGATSGPVQVLVNGRLVTSTQSFNVLPGFWLPAFETIAPGFEARNELVGFSIGSKGYCGLGFNGIHSLNDFWEYDIVTNEWKQITPCPVDLYGATAMVSNGKAYIIGGRSSNDPAHDSKEVWSYDPAVDAWQKKNDFPGVARHGAVGGTIGNLMCFFGGGADNSGHVLSDWWRYEPGSDFWVQQADVPEATLVAAPSFVFNDKLYAGIGSYGKVSSWYSFDPALNNWTKLANFPGKVVAAAAGFVLQETGKGYVCGGGDECWRYDVSADQWNQVGFYGDRNAACTFVISGNAYSVGGSATKKDMWVFVPRE